MTGNYPTLVSWYILDIFENIFVIFKLGINTQVQRTCSAVSFPVLHVFLKVPAPGAIIVFVQNLLKYISSLNRDQNKSKNM